MKRVGRGIETSRLLVIFPTNGPRIHWFFLNNAPCPLSCIYLYLYLWRLTLCWDTILIWRMMWSCPMRMRHPCLYMCILVWGFRRILYHTRIYRVCVCLDICTHMSVGFCVRCQIAYACMRMSWYVCTQEIILCLHAWCPFVFQHDLVRHYPDTLQTMTRSIFMQAYSKSAYDEQAHCVCVCVSAWESAVWWHWIQ